MPLPKFKTRDEIPEAFRGEYVEKGGEWVPNVEDTEGLKAAQRRALDEKKKLEDQLSGLLGNRKPEEIAEILKNHETAEEKRAREAGNFDKLLEKRINETKAEYEKRIDVLAPYKTKYEDRELEIAIRDAATKAGVLAADMDLVIPIVKGRRVKLDDAGKVIVVDKDGDATGLTPEKFFAETFKTEAPKFYAASGGSGGGANGGNGGKGGAEKGAAKVAAGDNAGFLANLDAIAKGTTKVVTE